MLLLLLLLAGTRVDLDSAAVPAASGSDNPAGSALQEKSALFDLHSGPAVLMPIYTPHWFNCNV